MKLSKSFIRNISISLLLFISNTSIAQDKILFKSGQETNVRILYETDNGIGYCHWKGRNKKDRKVFFVSYEEIDRIKYGSEVATERKHRVFFSTGSTIMGTGRRQVRDIMRKLGFDKPSQCFLWCSGTIVHPYTNNFPSALFEYEHLLKTNWGIGVQIGNTNSSETVGKSNIDGFIFIRQKNFTIIPFYSLYNRKHTYNLRAGISLNNYKTFRNIRNTGGKNVNIRNKIFPGLMLRGSMSISEIERSTFRLFIEGRLNGNAQIGPYDLSLSRTTFPEVEVNFSHIILGITYGRKYEDKKIK